MPVSISCSSALPYLFIVAGATLVSISWTIFFFEDTATTEIYTLSLHDALPICPSVNPPGSRVVQVTTLMEPSVKNSGHTRSEEHTSELQSQFHIVCRLLLE